MVPNNRDTPGVSSSSMTAVQSKKTSKVLFNVGTLGIYTMSSEGLLKPT
jgi:hypothetical protein